MCTHARVGGTALTRVRLSCAQMFEWERHQERMAERESATQAQRRSATQVQEDSASYSYSYTSVTASETVS